MDKQEIKLLKKLIREREQAITVECYRFLIPDVREVQKNDKVLQLYYKIINNYEPC